MLAVALLCLGGCQTSSDQHVFQSTHLRPANVTVIDAREGRPLWRMEVPVGHELTINLDRRGLEREGTRVSTLPANQLRWALHDIERPYNEAEHRVGQAIASDTVVLTGHPLRVHVTYRHSPAVSGQGPYRIEQLARPTAAEDAQDEALAAETDISD
ncbi:MAG: hypothetical protein ACODAQ_05880 [Phycisphaeraceae bacterium]